jgi:hypothetical protein
VVNAPGTSRTGPPPPGRLTRRHRRYGFSDFAPDEVAAELHLTQQSAAEQMWYAREVEGTLPRCFAALAAGQLHPVHLRIIEDETAMLSPHDRGRADEELAGVAGSLTFGQLRSKAHRLVLKLDPDAARKRKEQAKQDAHVRRFREDSGNAGMIARELPPDEVLASWQHVEQRAWTCAPPGWAARSPSSASAPTWTCFRSGTAAWSPPARA